MDLAGATIVVTGGTGFLGRRVCSELELAGSIVKAVAHHDYDLRQRAVIDGLLAECRPDAVVHLAAVVGGIGANRAEPGRFFYENVMMGAMVMEQARLASVEKFVGIGTICAY